MAKDLAQQLTSIAVKDPDNTGVSSKSCSHIGNKHRPQCTILQHNHSPLNIKTTFTVATALPTFIFCECKPLKPSQANLISEIHTWVHTRLLSKLHAY